MCSSAGGTGVCVAGSCRVLCDATHYDCDHDPLNGCESALQDAANCGACGRSCPAGPNQTSACTNHACAVTCSTGFSDCDGDPVNGCETANADSLANCGGCGT